VASSVDREKLARSGIDAYNAGDAAGMLARLSEDVEVFAAPELANSGRFHGHDGFLRWITEWTDAWEDIAANVIRAIPVGERQVVLATHQTGRGRSGIEVSMELAFIFDIRDDGLCSYLAMLPDSETAVALAREREAEART
jgi:ketosteroid isomerase-like protein